MSKLVELGTKILNNPEGYDVLGSGCFSTVWVHPEDPTKAIKISSKSNDGGVMYAFWARAHQDLKGVPVIHEIAQVQDSAVGPTLTFIVMDRYVMTYQEAERRDLVPYLGTSLMELVMSSGVSKEYVRDHRDYDALTTSIVSPYWDTLTKIGQFFKGACTYDLHGENVMLDANGELYITDPLSFVRS